MRERVRPPRAGATCGLGVVVDLVADERHDTILERREQHATDRPRGRGAARLVHDLDVHVLVVHVIAAARTLPGEEGLGGAVVVGDIDAENAADALPQRVL